MTTSTIKSKLHQFIENAEQKKLKAIYTIFENEIEASSQLTKAQKDELDFRLEEYLSGKTKTQTWDEVVKKAKAKR
jgi:putative addiction module component (TIGR02574 family)